MTKSSLNQIIDRWDECFYLNALYNSLSQIENAIFVRLDRLSGVHNKSQRRVDDAVDARGGRDGTVLAHTGHALDGVSAKAV